MIARAAILAEAHEWIGTPYRHQASAKGAGCDCLGLVRGVWRALYGSEPEALPAYTPDWAERNGAETLLAAARAHLLEIDIARMAPGDVLLFRMDRASPVKHAAILDEPVGSWQSAIGSTADCLLPTASFIIHAYWARAVVRSRFAPWWRARLAAAFSFPGVEPWPS